jgi:hypothetical protein
LGAHEPPGRSLRPRRTESTEFCVRVSDCPPPASPIFLLTVVRLLVYDFNCDETDNPFRDKATRRGTQSRHVRRSVGLFWTYRFL